MWSLLTLPITLFLELLGVKPSDFFYWCKWKISYIYLKLNKWTTSGRLEFFDYHSDDPEKNGYFSPEIEKELESPQPDHNLLEAQDKIFCYGVSSKSEFLLVSISRFCNERAEACIYLKLSGKTYQLKDTSNYQQPCSDQKVFSCGDLQMHYVYPMRLWRIFFSGYLKEIPDDNSKGEKTVYAKFALLWRASSDVFDFTSDISTELLADGLAQASWNNFWPPLTNYQKAFNMYAQSGVIMGTVSIDGSIEDQEIYLFGQRMRCLGERRQDEFHQILGYVHKNGTVVHFGTASVKNVVKNLHFGFVVTPRAEIKALNKVDISTMISEASDVKDIRADFQSEKDNAYAFSGSLLHSIVKPHQRVETGEAVYMNAISFHLNGGGGTGIFMKGAITAITSGKSSKTTIKPLPSVFPPVVAFADEICQLCDVTGGKGSSLGKLTHLSNTVRTFIVPKGVVVTTLSYQQFLNKEILKEIKNLENILYGNVAGDVKEACKRVSEKFVAAPVSNKIQNEIVASLKKIFGEKIHSQKFAVRSSATGEDTEQMSAAGQMETFLGVSGINEILTAVKKCWASQFGYVAVQYKRRYGQILNSPMAVVIQEMIDCDVAGVLFTCDPLTGSPTLMTITANYGLGESVVSGSEEPDTIELARDHNDKLQFKSSSTGAKSRKIIVKGEGTGLEEVSEEERNQCCLSQERALRLGELAVKIEKHYRSKRDIEWGFWNNNLYIFQSRPVTNENQETDFEIEHELDGPLRIENDYFSVSNAAEVLPGAMTPLGYDMFLRFFAMTIQREKASDWQPDPHKYFASVWITYIYHTMFNASDMFRMKKDEEMDNITKATMVAIMGRVIDEPEIVEISSERYPKKSKKDTLKSLYNIACVLFLSSRKLRKAKKYYEGFRIPVERCKTLEEMLEVLLRSSTYVAEASSVHMSCSQSSSIWNMSVLSTLVQAKKELDEDVYRDFSRLLTTSSFVESADVPSAIQNLAHHISQEIKPETFKKMQLQEALEWLNNSALTARKLFHQFLERHGHRCVKEFDIYSTTWGSDPRSLIKLLQNLVGNMKKKEKESASVSKIISQLSIPIGILSRLKLRVLLPLSRYGVQKRESSKSMLVKGIDAWRKAYRHLAKLMVAEGRIPDENLLFFMTVEDIRELLRTRSPKLLAKAYHRQKLYPQMDKYTFPELMRGVPKPLNAEETQVNDTGENFEMKGIPVSQGVAKGFVRVALSLEDATYLKPGEILLAYGTDIGWSPYFPIVSGVVTELGGLISHGAVVSREYGLPCIAGLHGATKNFKTGDYVLLDGNKGILRKLPPPKD